uniref:DNA double-strand break repair rad50 ATPase n=1 Tax=Rhizophora mucronata TaxID=61149 RepID=A0A2P2LUD0_RHIMU
MDRLETSLAIPEETESSLGVNASLEINFQDSPLDLGISNPPADSSGKLAVSMTKSSSVARDFSCFPKDAIVFWHSESFPAATSRSSCLTEVIHSIYMGKI